MIADDAKFMRMKMREDLRQTGFFDIVEAGNGEEAVFLFSETQPDLVLLDVIMPVKDGLTALKEIRENNPDARVVMCSTMDQENVIKAVQLGALDFIIKPFKQERLAQAVRNVLE